MRISDWRSDVCSSDLMERASEDVRRIVAPLANKPLSEISYGELLSNVMQVAGRHRVRLPRELVLVIKQILYFERYAKELAPGYHILSDPRLLTYLQIGRASCRERVCQYV